MRKKSKGVTLIELIIVMGLTLVILSAAYSFLNTSNKSTINAELRSMLQNEGTTIENKILNIATQAKGAKNIYSSGIKLDDIKLLNANLDSEGNISLDSIELEGYNANSSVIKLEDNILTITTQDKGSQVLSENVLEMKVQPLNINQFTEAQKGKKTIKEMSGYKFSFKLGAKRGTIHVNYDISVQANFRNYDVQVSKSKQEFNKIEEAITKVWNKSESISSIFNLEGREIKYKDINMYREEGLDVSKVYLKQYDGSVVSIDFSKPNLTIGKKEFNNVVEFKIKSLDENSDDSNEPSGVKMIITISEDAQSSTYEIILKSLNN